MQRMLFTEKFKSADEDRSYEKEFCEQYSQYETQKEIFLQAPSTSLDASVVSLRDLIDFVSHVLDCYPNQTKDFPQELIYILEVHHRELNPELREKIVGSLVLLRRKNSIDSPTYVLFHTDGWLMLIVD